MKTIYLLMKGTDSWSWHKFIQGNEVEISRYVYIIISGKTIRVLNENI